MSQLIETGMRSWTILAVVPLLLAMSAPAWARGTLDEILPQIRAQHPGKLSDAEPWTDSEGNPHYRIKWMTPEGRIIYFDADARTGRYSGTSGDEGNDWRNRRERDDSRGGRDQNRDQNDDGGHRSHWNNEDGDGGSGYRHGRDSGGWLGGGDWHGHDGGDRGGWRDGGNGGDTGDHHHHGYRQ
jgi:hypothetical protein